MSEERGFATKSDGERRSCDDVRITIIPAGPVLVAAAAVHPLESVLDALPFGRLRFGLNREAPQNALKKAQMRSWWLETPLQLFEYRRGRAEVVFRQYELLQDGKGQSVARLGLGVQLVEQCDPDIRVTNR